MFEGFSPAAADFLWGIRFNNDRGWFEANKETYKTSLDAPMKELCRELYAGLTEAHGDLTLMSKVSRIYRDARRLFGRGPYKDHLWLGIAQPGEESRPTFWFEISPEDYSYGLGYWAADALTMAKLRARMEHDPKTMEKLVRQLNKQEVFTLKGQDFKRRRPAPSPLLEPWYNKRQGLSLSHEAPHDELLYSPRLKEQIMEDWEKLIPLYRYLSTLSGDPDPRDVS